MKKGLLVILFSLFLVFGVFFFLKRYLNQPCTTAPEKASNIIPDDSFWSGGCDGGYWFHIRNRESSKVVRLQIFDDFKGELLWDANFVSDTICQELKLKNIEHLDSLFVSFEEGVVYLKEGYCNLVTSGKPYAGVFWEINKEIE